MADLTQVCAMPVQLSAEIRARGVPGETVTAWLTRDESSPSRSRGTAFFTVEVGLSWAPLLGHVLIVDTRGNPKKYTYQKAAEWLGKNMPGRAVALVLTVADSTAVAPAWTARRVHAMAQDAADFATNLPDYLNAAHAKKDKVADWLESDRKDAILRAVRAVELCAYFAETMADGGFLVGVFFRVSACIDDQHVP